MEEGGDVVGSRFGHLSYKGLKLLIIFHFSFYLFICLVLSSFWSLYIYLSISDNYVICVYVVFILILEVVLLYLSPLCIYDPKKPFIHSFHFKVPTMK